MEDLSPQSDSASRTQTPVKVYDIHKMEILAYSSSGVIFIIDKSYVLKINLQPQLESIERDVYKILQTQERSPYIAECLDIAHPQGLIFRRYGHTTIAERLRSRRIPKETTQKWMSQLLSAMEYIHNRDIIHGDLRCHNLLTDEEDNIILIDFAGSSINGSKLMVGPPAWSRLSPDGTNPRKEEDIFSFGCALYQMATRREPYARKRPGDVTKLYNEGKFPSTEHISNEKWVGEIIMKCWCQRYTTASEIKRDIDTHQQGLGRRRGWTSYLGF